MIGRSKKIILIAIVVLTAAGATGYFLIRSPDEKEPVTLLPPPEETYIVQGPLSPEKERIRQALIAPLNGKAGPIKETDNYRIAYLPAGPLFQVEIKTTHVAQAKEEALQFFKNKGFNEQDICNLPVSFYLGPEPSEKLKGSGVEVPPKPDFCQ